MINAIVAVDCWWGIGRNNDLLFHLKKDMEFFKEKTLNHTVLMGENTLLSMPNSKPLKNRTNVVLCPEGHEYEGCICFHNFEDIVDFAKTKAQTEELFVIGGARFYASMLDYCDRLYITKVAADGQAEVFFPEIDNDSRFVCVSESETIEDNGYLIRFCIYERRA